MKTVIYLDELLLTNFLAAAMLLLCTGLLCARQCSGLRLLAGSAAAAASSLGILLPELPGAAAVLCKVFTCGAVVAAAYGLPGPRGFARLCAWYLLLNLLLCGAAVLPGVQSANLCVYLALSPGRLLLCCGAISVLLRAVLFCFGRAGPRSVAAVLELNGVALPVQALCDTGFSVQDPLSGRAVVLLHYPSVRDSLPQALRAFLDSYLPAVRHRRRSWGCGWCPAPPLPGTACCLQSRPKPCAWAAAGYRVFWLHSAARKRPRSTGPHCLTVSWPGSWASADAYIIDVQEEISCSMVFLRSDCSGSGFLHGCGIAAVPIIWRARPACRRP